MFIVTNRETKWLHQRSAMLQQVGDVIWSMLPSTSMLTTTQVTGKDYVTQRGFVRAHTLQGELQLCAARSCAYAADS